AFTLQRNGFDVVFTPDPCFGYPPKTNIQFVIQGDNAHAVANPVLPTRVSAALEDVFHNKFARDLSLRWQVDPVNPNLWHSPLGSFDEFTGKFTMQFQTKGVK